MSAPTSSIAAVREAVLIEQVLLAHNQTVPTKGHRMACPIHGGLNPSAFSFGEERFRCFNCDAHGDVVDLERELGGGTTADALHRLVERHELQPGHVDYASLRRRRQRARLLAKWYRRRCNEWTAELVRCEMAVREWQCDPADADQVFWVELQRRCEARDRADALVETFRELRTVEQQANAFAVEQRGAVWLPSEARCA